MSDNTTRHPVFRIVMHDQGRSLVWLARETGFSHPYVKAVSAGIERGSPKFRAACARVLGLPESVLFHDGSSASRAEGDSVGSEIRADSAEPRPYHANGGVSSGALQEALSRTTSA